MMRIVEKSSVHLRLSDAGSSWGKWVFVGLIVAILLSGIFISANVIRPTCWSGVAIGCFMLFMLVRELPHNFDREFWFDRENGQLKVIKHPWLGRAQVEHYPLTDITEVKVVAKATRTHHHSSYDYDYDEPPPPVEGPKYDIELSIRFRNTLTIFWGDGEDGARQLARSITEFLGLTFATA
jgi:hypothetical protein